jgi:peptidoglycan/LPS O-acetylase OafA/YrhL
MIPARTDLRPPAPGSPAVAGHQDALDGLRAVAAGAVLVTHVGGLTGYVLTGTPASWVVSRGNIGVPIFFVLSGLLLYRPWAAAALAGPPAVRVTTYLRRRALRILPAYWAVVLLALPVLSPGPARHAWPWIQYLLLIQNYDTHPWWLGTGAPGLAQAWSLVVEVSFYLALPLLAAALTWFACRGRRAASDVSLRARRLLAGIAVLGASSFGWTVLTYYPHAEFWFSATLPPLMIWFAAGMAIAVASAWAAAEPGPDGPASRFCRAVASSAGMCGLVAGSAFAIACTPVTGPEFISVLSLWSAEIRLALFTVVALALVAPVAFAPQPARRVPRASLGTTMHRYLRSGGQPAGPMLLCRALGSPVPRFLGKISYGIFLWQLFIGAAFFAVLHLKSPFQGVYTGLQAAGILAAISVLTIAAATASYYLIERPARRLRFPRPHHDRTGASGLREDDSGRQPADNDQADDLGYRVPQPGHDQAGTPGP